MARIRTIKPEYWSSPDTAACDDPWARLLFIAMWNWADDTGRGTANPKELGGFAFPNDEKIETADIRRMLGEIRRAFGVTFYMVGGRPYYAIPSWDNHQKIDKRSGARHPAPEEGEEWDPDPTQPPDLGRRGFSEEPAESSAEPAESTPNPRRNLGAGTGEQGNRGTEEVTTSLSADAPRQTAPDPFDEFWAAYPRKVDKQAARKAWRAVLRKKVDPHQLVAAARSYAAQRAGQDPQFTKHAATWLNKGAYENEPEPSPPQLQLVSGGYQPYRNPTDPSVWDEPLLPPNAEEFQ